MATERQVPSFIDCKKCPYTPGIAPAHACIGCMMEKQKMIIRYLADIAKAKEPTNDR
jgi:hypothetical protein